VAWLRPWWTALGCAGALTACAALPRPPHATTSADALTKVPVLRSTAHVSATLSAGSRTAAPAPRTELYVRCEDMHSCPDAVGLLVVEAEPGSAPERCTISLIAPDRALTASHCLAPEQRHAGAACAGVWLSFPQTADAPQETVGCARVVSAVSQPDQDALRQEHAVLQLERPLARAALAIDATAPAADSIVMVASVTPHPVYGVTHTLTTRLCRAIGPERAEAALGPTAADVGWLESCPIAPGNSGSPVLDAAGRIRAIVHGGTASSSAYAVTSAPLP